MSGATPGLRLREWACFLLHQEHAHSADPKWAWHPASKDMSKNPFISLDIINTFF